MINFTYYSIDEERASIARRMWSFHDYKHGEYTSDYKYYVSQMLEACNFALKNAKEEKQKEKITRLFHRFNKKIADNINENIRIQLMYPSVMIAGPAKFNNRKKERQNNAQDKNYKDLKFLLSFIDKVKGWGNSQIIRSDSKDAEKLLQEKLDFLKNKHSFIKECNKITRKKGLEKLEKLKLIFAIELFSKKEKIQIMKKHFFFFSYGEGKGFGFSSYVTSYNLKKIREVESRIEYLKRLKNNIDTKKNNLESEYFEVVENKDNMRLQLFFNGKPSAEIRAILKKNGFKWASSQNAWQRLYNLNALSALNTVNEQISEL